MFRAADLTGSECQTLAPHFLDDHSFYFNAPELTDDDIGQTDLSYGYMCNYCSGGPPRAKIIIAHVTIALTLIFWRPIDRGSTFALCMTFAPQHCASCQHVTTK